MFDKDVYLKKLFNFTEKEAIKEICNICSEAGFNPAHYEVIILTGGLSYTLEKIAHDLYLTRRPIDDTIRQKLLLFNIMVETSGNGVYFPRINDSINREKKESWDWKREIERKNKAVAAVIKKVEEAYRNCYTCGDYSTGCRGEDEDCCSPEYKDWRDR